MSDETCMHVACGRRVAGKIPESCLKMCAKCKSIVYCSKKCQTLHWKTKHKKDCRKICEGNFTDDERQIILNVMDYRGKHFKDIVDSFEESMEVAACLRPRNPTLCFFINECVGCSYYLAEKYSDAIPIFVICIGLEDEIEQSDRRCLHGIDNLRNEWIITKTALAHCYTHTFFFSSAREQFNNALNCWYEMIPTEIYVDALLGSADLYRLVGDYKTALTTLNKIVVILSEDFERILHVEDLSGGICNAEYMCKTHDTIATCYLAMGYYGTAIDKWEGAEQIINRLVDKSHMKYVMLGLGESWCMLENYTEAMKYNSKGFELAKKEGRKIDIVWAEVNMAMILLHGGGKCEINDGIQEARNFLISATEKACGCVRTMDATLHLSYISLAMKNEEDTLKYLYEYLDMFTKNAKQRCAGCRQDRSDAVSMLKCSKCKVARCVSCHNDFTH